MEKIYCGNAKIITTQFGELTKVSFSKDDINKIVKHMKDNSLDWANLVIKEKKDKVEGKPTHYLEIDNWKPSEEATRQPQPVEDNSETLPF
jgi:hypothetical protein